MLGSIVQVDPVLPILLMIIDIIDGPVSEKINDGLLQVIERLPITGIQLRIQVPFRQYHAAMRADGSETGDHEDRVIVTITAHSIQNGFTGSGKILVPFRVGYILEVGIDILEKREITNY